MRLKPKSLMALVLVTTTLFNPVFVERSSGATATKIKLSQAPQIVAVNARISLSAEVSSSGSRVGWQGKLQVSKDDGETWSTQKLTKGTIIKASRTGKFEMQFKVLAGEYVVRLSAENKLKNQKAYSNSISFMADDELKYFAGIEINGDPDDLTSEDSFIAFLPSGFFEDFGGVVISLEAIVDDEFVTIEEMETSEGTEIELPLTELDGEYELFVSIIDGDGELLTRYELGTFIVTGI